jgi:hypothetical protein
MNIVTIIEFGSHLYGTSTSTSDRDYKSVYLPDARDILLQRVKESVGARVKSREGVRNTPDEIDDEAYSLQRYLQLLAEGQTVAIDMLFAPDASLIASSSLWAEIRVNKPRLLTKRSAAFVGYCRTQANKYSIKGSRVAAAKQAAEFFASAYTDCGDAQVRVNDLDASSLIALCTDEHTRVVTIETTPGREETFFECCGRKVSFGNTVKAAAEIYSRIYENYGARARLAQSNEGIDWKALSHAVRVAHEAVELLRNHTITFPLVVAPMVLSIKLGEAPYDQVARLIEDLLVDVEAAAAESTLPDEADRQWIDDFVIDAYERQVIKGAL